MKNTTPFGSVAHGARKCRAWLACILIGVFFAGCSILPKAVEDSTRYYLLTSRPGADPTAATAEGNLRVGLRTVDLPVYLRNTRTLVVRTGAHEIRYQDLARWAEPLDLAVQQAVRRRLQASEAVAGAEMPPFSTEVPRDFDVIIRVLQCEGGSDARGQKTAEFSATYEILDLRNPERPAIRKTFSGRGREWDGQDFAILAARLSDEVAALADDIAANLPK